MGWESSALLAWGVAVAVSDARSRRLPNGLTLGAVAFATGYLLLWDQAPTGAPVASALVAAGLALLVTLPAYVARWLGGGDVKLAFAIALLGGTKVFLATLVGGGVLLAAILWPLRRVHHRSATPQRFLPYGTAHGIGFIVALAAAPWLPGPY